MFTIAWGSCEEKRADFVSAYNVVSLYNPVAFFSLGDNPYINGGADAFGYTTTPVTVGDSVSTITNHYHQMFAKSGWTHLRENTDVYLMPDDHEWGGDNWDHTLTQSESGNSPLGAATQAEVDLHYYRGAQAFQAAALTYSKNPVNTDDGVVAEKPSGADAGTSVNNYPPLYFRVGYDENGAVNNNAPLVEFFVIECIGHRSPIANADAPSKTMLGSAQLAWLKSAVVNSAATFKVIVSPKKTFNSATGDNGDTWGEYTVERDDILGHFDGANVKGVLWISGDKHYPHVINTRKHACVVACPLSVETNAPVDVGTTSFGVLVGVGDSLIATWGTGQIMQAMAARLNFSSVINKGVGGRFLEDVDAAFIVDAVDSNADIVVCMVADWQDRTANENQQMQAALQSIVAKCAAAKITPIICNHAPFGKSAWTQARQDWTDEWNNWIASYTSANNIAFVDAWSLLVDPGTYNIKNEYDSGDGLHLNTAGYNLIGHAAAEAHGHIIVCGFDRQVFGVLEIEKSIINAHICCSATGNALWSGRLAANTNTLAYKQNKLALAG